jgi:hypothetical protein
MKGFPSTEVVVEGSVEMVPVLIQLVLSNDRGIGLVHDVAELGEHSGHARKVRADFERNLVVHPKPEEAFDVRATTQVQTRIEQRREPSAAPDDEVLLLRIRSAQHAAQ